MTKMIKNIFFICFATALLSCNAQTNSEEKENVEGENINVDLDEETNELINTDHNSKNEKNDLSSTESKEVSEDPRRKRRRSSASS